MHGAHAGRRTRAAGGVTLVAALALAAAPAASAHVTVPDPATALPAVSRCPRCPPGRADAPVRPPGRAPRPRPPFAPRCCARSTSSAPGTACRRSPRTRASRPPPPRRRRHGPPPLLRPPARRRPGLSAACARRLAPARRRRGDRLGLRRLATPRPRSHVAGQPAAPRDRARPRLERGRAGIGRSRAGHRAAARGAGTWVLDAGRLARGARPRRSRGPRARCRPPPRRPSTSSAATLSASPSPVTIAPDSPSIRCLSGSASAIARRNAGRVVGVVEDAGDEDHRQERRRST